MIPRESINGTSSSISQKWMGNLGHSLASEMLSHPSTRSERCEKLIIQYFISDWQNPTLDTYVSDYRLSKILKPYFVGIHGSLIILILQAYTSSTPLYDTPLYDYYSYRVTCHINVEQLPLEFNANKK